MCLIEQMQNSSTENKRYRMINSYISDWESYVVLKQPTWKHDINNNIKTLQWDYKKYLY